MITTMHQLCVEEVTAQLQKLTIGMIGNENTENKQGKEVGSLMFLV